MSNPLQEKVVIDSIISVQHLCNDKITFCFCTLNYGLYHICNIGVKYVNYKFKKYNNIIYALPR